MDRKAIANETLCILRQGYYEYNHQKVEIAAAQKKSEEKSVLFTPEQGAELVMRSQPVDGAQKPVCIVEDKPTVQAILDLTADGAPKIGVLNFASGKNPGGGFLNGAMAQEESLAASSGLYRTLLKHPEYYEANRACKSMVYTNHAIYSPDVVFFRDGAFRLIKQPVTASVLTLPAVNYGQVLQKGEDTGTAKQAMQQRMRLALCLLAAKGNKTLILGAYGCGVFRNDPADVAVWWMQLLEKGYGAPFERILFAVMDNSKNKACIRAFRNTFGEN